MEEFLLPCLNKEIFGLECYGCGGQRAVLLIFNGKFLEAFLLFPAIYPLLILLIFVLFNLFFKFKNDYSIKIGLILFVAAVLLINYLYRMYQFLN